MIFNYAAAIASLYPELQFACTGESYENLNVISGEKPSKQELDAEIERLKEEWDALEYQRLRAASYPTMADQMDMQYHDALNGTTNWQDAINAVKAKYPKPEGM